MRTDLLAHASAGTLILAAPACAQMAPIGPGSGMQNQYQDLPDGNGLPPAYVKKITALSYRTLALRTEDGGKLTPEHLAGLQRELTHLKRKYRVVDDRRIKG
jgi:hypothetical protein